ncbi:DMT family transporter [Nitratireductor alexandrii]|uniref:DMT family transporter n=1 Tax=Nitratireductor alexandrii TaxID=2448161 RepID=UPI001EE882CD|nr:DMT family transporter [Nitratireductor alexandrii]
MKTGLQPTPAAGGAVTSNMVGILCAMGAATAFSLNDVVIKYLSGDYPLHQITFLRSLIGITVTLAVFVPLDGSYRDLRTDRLGFHLMRGMIVVCANMTFYAALATLPLGEATAIYFVGPLFITALSVVLLGETVGPRRWFAVLVGLAGVLIVIRPGGSAFQYAAFLPLIAAFGYSLFQITTRKLGLAAKASTMSFYINLVFIGFSGMVGLVFGDGRYSGTGNANLEFLLRAWTWPPAGDFVLLGAIGVVGSTGGYLVSQAYRQSQAGLIAPFEYIALPLAIFWSIMIWGDWPDAVAWLGIALIAAAGFYVLYREAALGRRIRWKTPFRRER